MKSSQVKSTVALFSLTVVFFLTLILCGVSYADFAYISDDFRNSTYISSDIIRYIKQDSSGNLQETSHTISANGYHRGGTICFFRHKGQKRLFALMDKHNSDASDTIFGAIFDPDIFYDPNAFCYPLVWIDAKDWNIDLSEDWHLYALYEFGDNIILGMSKLGMPQTSSEGSINFEAQTIALLEINPETGALANSYTHDLEAGNDFYDGGYRCLAVHKNVIYLDTAKDIIMMDSVGHVTGRISDTSLRFIPSGENLYAINFSRTSNNDSEPLILINGDISGLTLTSSDFFSRYAANAEGITDLGSGSKRIYLDGSGGVYYVPAIDMFGYGSEIRHWDGSNNTSVYSTNGDNIEDLFYIRYDSYAKIMFIGCHVKGKEYNMPYAVYTVAALKQDSSGNFTLAQIFGDTVIDSGFRELTVIDSTPNSSAGSTSLPSATIEPAPALSSTTLQNLASLVSIDPSALNMITQENISAPSDPAQSMKDYMQSDGYDAAYALNTLTVNEDGYYVFMVNIPDELVGKKVSGIKIYALKNADFASAFYGLLNGVLNYGEVTNLLGVKIDTLEKQVLAVGLLQAGTPFSMYLAKLIIALLAGGCSLSGTGVFMLCAVCLAGIFFVKR